MSETTEVPGTGVSVCEEVLVRIARRADVPAIVALLADDMLGRTREDPSDLDPYVEAFDEMALDPNSDLLVLDLDGEVVGTAHLVYGRSLARKGQRRCTLESVQVAARLRSRGLGALLIGAAIDLARAHGCGSVQLTSHKSRTDAHRFYRRLGFEASHEGMKLIL